MKKFEQLPVVHDDPRPPKSDGSAAPVSPTGGCKQVELSPIHDFARKLRQEDVLPRLGDYVRWQARLRGTLADGGPTTYPDYAPVSINLDLTTSCNYACDHCVDMDILNTGIKHSEEKLFDSISLMAEKGLRSVIVIGGGEPTVDPRFERLVRHMKGLDLQVSVVSNGSGNKKLAKVADVMTEGDWIRLSLDAGTDETFQAMHHPKKKISLFEICDGIRPIKEVNDGFPIGFSFIITWKGAFINDTNIVANIDEIPAAAELARRSGFDYIAFKPFLTRAERNNAEVVDLREADTVFDEVTRRIRAAVDEAKKQETDGFRVYETTNLKVLENKSHESFAQQPRQCHMQFFRQVLSPLGTFNCPVYRNQPHGRIGDSDAYASLEDFEKTKGRASTLIERFDAATECREVTCLYNHANWWMEDLIEHPEKLEDVERWAGEEPDYFL